MSNVGRVATRDSSRATATVQDLFVALCEDDSIYSLFKTMKGQSLSDLDALSVPVPCDTYLIMANAGTLLQSTRKSKIYLKGQNLDEANHSLAPLTPPHPRTPHLLSKAERPRPSIKALPFQAGHVPPSPTRRLPWRRLELARMRPLILGHRLTRHGR